MLKNQKNKKIEDIIENKLNEIRETIKKEQEICGVTEDYKKIEKRNPYFSRTKIIEEEIYKRMDDKFFLETDTKELGNPILIKIIDSLDKEIKASQDKIKKVIDKKNRIKLTSNHSETKKTIPLSANEINKINNEENSVNEKNKPYSWTNTIL